MQLERPLGGGKGWLAGHWNSQLSIAVGYADSGIDEPHLHSVIAEVYLVASGTATIRVELESVELKAGDLLVVEAGEAHTFVSSSPDYFHFVIHTASGIEDRQIVKRSRLGLGPSG